MTQPATAKRLLLSLLSAPDLPEASLAQLVKWGELFAIDPPTLRVTIGRLKRQQLLASPRRGVYCIGPAGQLMAEKAQNWRFAEDRIIDWQGQWLLAHTGHLGRANRTALRSRERAFRLSGFAEFVSGLWLRPANFLEPPAATRNTLLSLGLETAAVVTRVDALPGIAEEQLYSLWPHAKLNRAYQQHCETMASSAARLPALSLAAAAKETLEVGEAVIRQINSDPLLPQAITATTSRSSMIEAMVRYDVLGRETWHRYINEQ